MAGWLIAALLAAGLFMALRGEVEAVWARAAVAALAGALVGGAIVIGTRRRRVDPDA
jgi:hypothetical protein